MVQFLPRLFIAPHFIYFVLYYFLNSLDDLVTEKEKYKDIGDDLDTAFVELILKE